MKTTQTVTRQLVLEADRLTLTATLFGISFPMRLEPTVFDMAGRLAPEYSGGYWNFYALSNGGFYMAPKSDSIFAVSCDNGFEGKLSSDALGIATCMYTYGHLSFGEDALADKCAQHYHWLRKFMLGHAEAGAILGAID